MAYTSPSVLYEIKAALERIEAKMNNDQPQPASDEREHRALVMVLRALLRAKRYIGRDDDCDLDPVIAVAEFLWPEAIKEAVKD